MGKACSLVNEWLAFVRPDRAACKKTAMGRRNAADPDIRATLSDECHTYGTIESAAGASNDDARPCPFHAKKKHRTYCKKRRRIYISANTNYAQRGKLRSRENRRSCTFVTLDLPWDAFTT